MGSVSTCGFAVLDISLTVIGEVTGHGGLLLKTAQQFDDVRVSVEKLQKRDFSLSNALGLILEILSITIQR